MDRPDYANYSFTELIDARRNLDSDRYPERSKELEAEIERRRKVEMIEPLSRPEGRDTDWIRIVFALFLGASGIASIALTIDASTWKGGVLVLPALGLAFVAFGTMVAASLSVLKRSRLGMRICAVLLLIQIPTFQVGKIAYTISTAPSLELKLWPKFGFAFSVGNAFTVFYHDTSRSFYLGINVMAVFFVLLLVLLSSSRSAIHRLLIRRSAERCRERH